jgi:hypothetical protein
MIKDRIGCRSCSTFRVTDEEALSYQCSTCHGLLSPVLRGPQPLSQLIDPSLGLPWRYPALLPLPGPEAFAPAVCPPTRRSALLEAQLDVSEAWLIDCTKFGTGTFKDLEAAVVIAAAAAMGIPRISVHSTGNTALAYRHSALRAGIGCASYVPLQNAAKLGGITRSEEHPVYLVDAEYARVPSIARAESARAGWHHMAPIGWKLEGKAALAWWIAEVIPQVTAIAQTVAGGYGALGYETGFRRMQMAASDPAGVLLSRRYLLFQPQDAGTLTHAWARGTRSLDEAALSLPSHPYEPTLQSSNPVATLPRLRSLMPDGTQFTSVSRDTVEGARSWVDAALADAGIELDFAREKSAYIALAGLWEISLPRSEKLAVIVSGSPPFDGSMRDDAAEILRA